MAKASALASVMYRNLNARTSDNAHLIDKVPHYVQREKDRKAVAKRNKKNAIVKFKGHFFELKQFNQVEYCNQTQKIIWGIAPQGYKCSSKYNHRTQTGHFENLLLIISVLVSKVFFYFGTLIKSVIFSSCLMGSPFSSFRLPVQGSKARGSSGGRGVCRGQQAHRAPDPHRRDEHLRQTGAQQEKLDES